MMLLWIIHKCHSIGCPIYHNSNFKILWYNPHIKDNQLEVSILIWIQSHNKKWWLMLTIKLIRIKIKWIFNFRYHNNHKPQHFLKTNKLRFNKLNWEIKLNEEWGMFILGLICLIAVVASLLNVESQLWLFSNILAQQYIWS